MKPLLIGIALLVTACTAVGPKMAEYQSQCHDEHQKFIALVECIEANARVMTRERDGDFVRLYLAEAGLLALRVQYGGLDDRTAWHELEKQLALFQRQSITRNSLRMQAFGEGLQGVGAAMERARPLPPPRQPITCYFAGRTMTCN